MLIAVLLDPHDNRFIHPALKDHISNSEAKLQNTSSALQPDQSPGLGSRPKLAQPHSYNTSIMTERSRSTSTEGTIPDFEFNSSITGEPLGSRNDTHVHVDRPRTTKMNTWQCCKCTPPDHPHRADNYFHAHHVNFDSLQHTIMTDEFESLSYDEHYSESNSSGSSKLSEKARQERKMDDVLTRDGSVIANLDLVSTPAPEGHFSHVPAHITRLTEVFYTREEFLEGEAEFPGRVCENVPKHPDATLEEQMRSIIHYKCLTSFGHHRCGDCLQFTRVVYWVKNYYERGDGNYEPVVVRMSLEDGEKFHRSKKGWIDAQGERRMVVRDFVYWTDLVTAEVATQGSEYEDE